MRFVELFENQDTAFEFDRVLRNLARYQVVRQRISSSVRKNPSGAFAVSYEIGLRAAQRYAIVLLHLGKGVVDISVLDSKSESHDKCVIATESDTDSFGSDSMVLRTAIIRVGYLFMCERSRKICGHSRTEMPHYKMADYVRDINSDSPTWGDSSDVLSIGSIH